MPRFTPRWVALACVFIASGVVAQQPHWYVLLEPGNERWYHGQEGHDVHELVTSYQDGWSLVDVSQYYQGELEYSWVESWRIDVDGDVWRDGICYIDMPLEVGKNWGTTWGEWGQYHRWFTIVAMDDSYGPNTVVIAEEEAGMDYTIYFTRWYTDGIGLVHYTISCFMCSFSLLPVVVDAERRTWSDIKALYSDPGKSRRP